MDSSFAYLINMLRRDFKAYSYHCLAEAGLTPGLYPFILYTGKHPGCAQKDMTASLHMDPGYTARAVTRLEAEGFLERRRNERDRRAQCLYLTDKGEQTFRLCYDVFVQWDGQALSVLTPEEQEQLRGLLLRVRKARKEQVEPV